MTSAFIFLAVLGWQPTDSVVLASGRTSIDKPQEVAIVDFDGIIHDVSRTFAAGPTPLKAQYISVIAKSGGAPLTTLVGGLSLTPFKSAKGRYALVYFNPPKPNGHRYLFEPLPGDADPIFAIEVPLTFKLKTNESPRVFCYRALAESWANISASKLQNLLQKMPRPGPKEWSFRNTAYAPESREIAELASSLEPVRRSVILTDLVKAGQVPAFAELADVVWQARDIQEMALIDLPRSLVPPIPQRHVSAKSKLERIELVSVDAVRALLIRSMNLDGTVELSRFAKLMRTSGPLAQHEIVSELSIRLKDSAWDYRALKPDKQREMLPSFVQHYLSAFGG